MTRWRVIYWLEPRGVCDGGDYRTAEHASRVAIAVWHRREVERVEVVKVEMVIEPTRAVDVRA